uniref:LAGLIDADG homing endonuclease n=1 Tax=Tricholoma terreum TaxID=76328 RepID=A0A6C0W496_9AGAR|nr:LAGLIDADG homing endonuclease [Tricholoma terreum]QIC20249.1 LAGLIDADG homing endonuclease [Tricholoma terreum]
MNKTLKDMLIGVILGDAHLKRLGLDKAFISFEQSNKKAEYLNHLLTLTKEELPVINEEVKEYSREDQRYNTTNKSLYFRTKSVEELKPFADLFLDSEGKKVIPLKIAEHLTPRSLAFWIMDDGQQVKRGGVTLCTDSFKSDEIQILREALKTNFNLETSIHKKKSNRIVKPSMKESI